MTKQTKLKICNWTLLVLTLAILSSGIQLELNPGAERVWVWVHIVLGVAFTAMIFWHGSLYHKRRNKGQPKKLRRSHKKPVTGILFLMTLLSSIIATCHWVGPYSHTITGGIHGKIGFLFIIAVSAHIAKRRRFYLRRLVK